MPSRTDTPRVAFQGERGAFSEEAIVALLGENVRLVPCDTFEALFAAIPARIADLALAPLENTLAGSVHQSYDLLLESSLLIVNEVIIPIAHNLIGCPGATLSGIREVQSHPVALAQCLGFFVQHPEIQRVVAGDTAGSVREVIERGDPKVAAIAGRRAAEIYGGAILKEHLEDHRENYTRFVLLSGEPRVSPVANKLSLVVRVKHQPGALYAALGALANREINLLKIESRPLKGSPWQYSFYLDIEGSVADAHVAAALDELRANAEKLRILGCYPAARRASDVPAAINSVPVRNTAARPSD
jgi:prephenate dehydratase